MPRPIRTKKVRGSPIPASGGIRSDIRSLNSSILLITQKMKYLVRNEKILGRNLIVLNKKIKGIESKITAGKEKEGEEGASSEAVKKLEERIISLEADNADMRARLASKEDLHEIKFVIDSINPLEFASLSQVRELIDKRVDELNRRETRNSSQPATNAQQSQPVAQQSTSSNSTQQNPSTNPSKEQNSDGSIN